MNKFSVSAILCAAGSSARMGSKNKLLLPYAGKSIIQHCVANLLAADIEELIVVVGFQSDALELELYDFTDAIKIVKNEAYQTGHTSSIKCGVRAMNNHHSAFLIGLGDMPLISTKYYDQIIKHFKEAMRLDNNAIARPTYQGTPGHPVIMSTSHKEEILSCTDQEGCRSVIKSNSDLLSLMETSEKCYIQDTDTPESYKSLIADNL